MGKGDLAKQQLGVLSFKQQNWWDTGCPFIQHSNCRISLDLGKPCPILDETSSNCFALNSFIHRQLKIPPSSEYLDVWPNHPLFVFVFSWNKPSSYWGTPIWKPPYAACAHWVLGGSIWVALVLPPPTDGFLRLLSDHQTWLKNPSKEYPLWMIFPS